MEFVLNTLTVFILLQEGQSPGYYCPSNWNFFFFVIFGNLCFYSWFETFAMFWIFFYFLLGNSPASEFYMPTFRNTLSVPSS